MMASGIIGYCLFRKSSITQRNTVTSAAQRLTQNALNGSPNTVGVDRSQNPTVQTVATNGTTASQITGWKSFFMLEPLA
jgi:hypothetical protein